MEIPGIVRVIAPTGPVGPLVVDVPHAGRTYPTDFRYTCPYPLLRQAEDAYVDELVAGATAHGIPIVAALFPRAMIDVNRALDDLDPALVDGVWPEPLQPTERTLQGLGLIRRMCRGGVPMYDAPLPLAEIDQRIRQFYTPYHRQLNKQLRATQQRCGEVWLINCHSMPSRGLEDRNGNSRRADFVLGDREGQSCPAFFTQQAASILRALGYSVAINDPYKGVEILRRYGQPKRQSYALQLEINRALYLDEEKVERLPTMERLKSDLTEFFGRMLAVLSQSAFDRAAE